MTRSTLTYAGSVGELLGVGLFAALWAGFVTVAVFRTGALPRWVGGFGVITTVLLALPLLEIIVDTGPLVTVSTTAFSLWLIMVGVTLVIRLRKKSTISKQGAKQ